MLRQQQQQQIEQLKMLLQKPGSPPGVAPQTTTTTTQPTASNPLAHSGSKVPPPSTNPPEDNLTKVSGVFLLDLESGVPTQTKQAEARLSQMEQVQPTLLSRPWAYESTGEQKPDPKEHLTPVDIDYMKGGLSVSNDTIYEGVWELPYRKTDNPPTTNDGNQGSSENIWMNYKKLPHLKSHDGPVWQNAAPPEWEMGSGEEQSPMLRMLNQSNEKLESPQKVVEHHKEDVRKQPHSLHPPEGSRLNNWSNIPRVNSAPVVNASQEERIETRAPKSPNKQTVTNKDLQSGAWAASGTETVKMPRLADIQKEEELEKQQRELLQRSTQDQERRRTEQQTREKDEKPKPTKITPWASVPSSNENPPSLYDIQKEETQRKNTSEVLRKSASNLGGDEITSPGQEGLKSSKGTQSPIQQTRNSNRKQSPKNATAENKKS